MPDTPPDSPIERWADKIMRWLTPLILAYIATIATNNHNRGEVIEKKVESVQDRQQEAVVKTEEVKEAVDKRAAVADEKAALDAKAIEANLYGTWVYLKDQGDLEKAADAKRTLDEFKAKNAAKKGP